MYTFRLSFLTPCLIFLSNALLAAPKNVTINDDSPEIVYVGTWGNSTDGSGSYMNGHRYTTVRGSRATFNFTGIAVYYIVPLFAGYPAGVSTLISLDGGEPVWVNLSSSTDQHYAVRWQALGLVYAPHTVSVFPGKNSAGQRGTWGQTDAFMYTEPDLVSNSSISSISSHSPTSLASSLSSSLSSKSLLGRSSTFVSSSSVTSVPLGDSSQFPHPVTSPLSSRSFTPSRTSSLLSTPARTPSSSASASSSSSPSVPVPSSSKSSVPNTSPSSTPSQATSRSLPSSEAPTASSSMEPTSVPPQRPPIPQSSLLATVTPPSSILGSSSTLLSTLQGPPSSSINGLFSLVPRPKPITLLPLANYATPGTRYSQGPVASLTLNSTNGSSLSALGSSATPFSERLSRGTQLSPSQKGGIAGGSIATGVIVVTLVTVAAAHSAHLIYIIVSLASLLFGLVLYNCRRIVFVCEDLNLPELQISLFLTIEAAREHEDSSKNNHGNQHLVWKVFSVGGNTKEFDVTVPITTGRSKKAGQPKIGFATIDDNDFDERVRPQSWELAPARLLENGIWEKGNVEANQEDELIAENMTERARRIAMGVSDKPDDPEARCFSPFLVIDSKNFGSRGNFKVKSDIFLHAFRTGGCKAGDYGDPVMEARKLDRLTDMGGHRVKDLDQVTTFYVTCSKKSGQVELKIGKNRPEDVKKFRQEHGFRFWCHRGKEVVKNEGNSTTSLLPL